MKEHSAFNALGSYAPPPNIVPPPPPIRCKALLGDLKSLQRYECTIVHEKDPNGDYVLWEDIQRLIAAYTPNPAHLARTKTEDRT